MEATAKKSKRITDVATKKQLSGDQWIRPAVRQLRRAQAATMTVEVEAEATEPTVMIGTAWNGTCQRRTTLFTSRDGYVEPKIFSLKQKQIQRKKITFPFRQVTKSATWHQVSARNLKLAALIRLVGPFFGWWNSAKNCWMLSFTHRYRTLVSIHGSLFSGHLHENALINA